MRCPALAYIVDRCHLFLYFSPKDFIPSIIFTYVQFSKRRVIFNYFWLILISIGAWQIIQLLNLDLVIDGDAPVTPPFDLNLPFWASSSFSCIIFISLQAFENFNFILSSSVERIFACYLAVVSIFLRRAVISADCLLLSLVSAVYIFWLRDAIHASFSCF